MPRLAGRSGICATRSHNASERLRRALSEFLQCSVVIVYRRWKMRNIVWLGGVVIFDPAIDGVEHYIRIFALLIDFLAIPSTLLNNLPHHLYSHNCLRSPKSFVVAMAALKLSGFPSSVQAYQTFVRNTSPGPLPPAKLVISGSRWDSEIFIALYALADEERPGYIHPTIR